MRANFCLYKSPEYSIDSGIILVVFVASLMSAKVPLQNSHQNKEGIANRFLILQTRSEDNLRE
jgi:hypothetical protein